MRLVEQIFKSEHNQSFRTRYMQYRGGRLKHQYWMWNRKRQSKIIDSYDAEILKNTKPGKTAFFCSSGYYLKEIWPEIDSIELHSVIKEFYPTVHLVSSRNTLSQEISTRYDNFAVVNNRGDHWTNLDGLTEQLIQYTSIMNAGGRLFYSFRDTQIQINRLTTNLEEQFLAWANSLSSIGLSLVWFDIAFPKKLPYSNNQYDLSENPDTTNGNLKFWFVYKGDPWTKIE